MVRCAIGDTRFAGGRERACRHCVFCSRLLWPGGYNCLSVAKPVFNAVCREPSGDFVGGTSWKRRSDKKCSSRGVLLDAVRPRSKWRLHCPSSGVDIGKKRGKRGKKRDSNHFLHSGGNGAIYIYIEIGKLELKEYMSGASTGTRDSNTDATSVVGAWYDVYMRCEGSHLEVWRGEEGAPLERVLETDECVVNASSRGCLPSSSFPRKREPRIRI